ncbi:hypothetical protein [Sinorhizobium alkalisoli]|uniref:Uncharacterized protein n=1 Tax=Sinorhizobium alkalisoli TaxID=1752398 RepID=A0A1E3VDN7_9HYPH|nr:hypothetical protein [Sinorhizobium alkalisoli]MCA1494256.1 hypothetical protein [Ensifer sp. NBAIM29]MCG5479336.1 hypothetical protein [Sinorhizobium alkalisoli]ODR91698.1 hypothetical protein A8M32_09670 [Sinorhizobium alkalisoli]QFI67412.1 hypothetical protein EKH55_2538 [Sinorhizobium alkalisoli]
MSVLCGDFIPLSIENESQKSRELRILPRKSQFDAPFASQKSKKMQHSLANSSFCPRKWRVCLKDAGKQPFLIADLYTNFTCLKDRSGGKMPAPDLT